ncbi:heavy metal translocating P-type ATPase [Actinomyces sp. oral taxon 171]|uniref:heavy metal translocating P-type ATPase n=4 Tax=Actinomyces sp. oral taxon 171 TaxID=706438 RepID=UPI0010FBF684|nr:heavy metal translocating P-type ATPase [Actinomyces sp. oral taxon 171]QCT32144.1 copper-translocating P-type ATPase [Actinomyces sp. oral taxon 171 str. F0337]
MSTTSQESGGQQRTVSLSIGGMTCASCVARVEKKLNKLDGVSASVNLATESARVTAPSAVSVDDLLATVARAGYTGALLDAASPDEPVESEASPAGEPASTTSAASVSSAASASGPSAPGSAEGRRSAKGTGGRATLSMAAAPPETRPGAPVSAGGASPRSASGQDAPTLGASHVERAADLRLRLLYCLILSVPIMAISMVPALQMPGWQWTVALMALPVAVWGAWPFHKAAFRALRHGAFTMDTLVSLGVIAATAWSLWALVLGGAGHIGMRMSMELLPRSQGHAAHMYFESAAWVTTFLLAGRYAEARAKYRSGDALRALLELGAKEVTRVVLTSPSGSRDAADVLDEDGSPRAEATRTEERISTEELAAGDLFLVRPGEKVATDGVVVEGRSAVDASLLTGESVPTEVEAGQTVTGATVNTSGVLLVRATAVGEGTTLARIGRMVTAAQAGKAPVQRLADRVSGVFVPIVLVLSAATLAGWLLTGHSPQAAFTAAVAVLVIACPCALGLATPTALLVGSGRAAQLGVVIKGPEVLESTQALDTMVMDKTGTVTQGRMSLEIDACREVGRSEPTSSQVPDSAGSGEVGAGASGQEDALASLNPLGDEALRLAGTVESASEHPVAAAITAAARERLGDLPAPTGFSNHEGRGVSATVEGRRVAVGRPGWLADEMGAEVPEAVRAAVEGAQDSGATAVVVAVGAADTTDTVEAEADADKKPLQAVAVLVVRDTVRPSSRAAVAALRELGIRPVLLTGDNARAAEHVAAQVGIGAADVRAEVLPADKRDVVADLQAQGAVVGMVGDGVNDAAALAQAGTQGLGFAMGSGADVAIEAADITLVRTDLDAAVAAVRVSRATLRIIRQNLFWAFAYNVAAIPLAAAGLLNPMIAGAAMAASSVIVVTNSLRLRRAG